MKKEIKKCPICHGLYTDAPALSRKDNKTLICPNCGMNEAMEAFKAAHVAPEKPHHMTVREKLEAIAESEELNRERVQRFLEEQKNQ